MNFKKQGIGILIVAMSLATAWAVRGQFGHEQGAAWAGAIGGLALVLVSKRKDWYDKMVLVALASGIGWGAGGMISYGMVVGYGHSNDFLNAFYGIGMLFVIGALFGLLGGGLVGLVLDSTKNNKVRWGAVVSEMVAGGLISYFFLVEQIGFKMTPPRSEAWAIIFGAGLAMLWYMARENRHSAIRVAIFSAFGAGFGFAFGNFLQVLGNVYEVTFNMWNVMEYCIGFFGGSAMAYGVYSSAWPIAEAKPKIWTNRVALFVVAVFIPLIVYRESLSYDTLLKRLGELPNIVSVTSTSTIAAALILLTMALILIWKLNKSSFEKRDVVLFLFVYLGVYIVMSYLVTGLFAGDLHVNHHLYILNVLILFMLIKGNKYEVSVETINGIHAYKWLGYFLVLVLFLALLAFIATSVHGELPGRQNRF